MQRRLSGRNQQPKKSWRRLAGENCWPKKCSDDWRKEIRNRWNCQNGLWKARRNLFWGSPGLRITVKIIDGCFYPGSFFYVLLPLLNHGYSNGKVRRRRRGRRGTNDIKIKGIFGADLPTFFYVRPWSRVSQRVGARWRLGLGVMWVGNWSNFIFVETNFFF